MEVSVDFSVEVSVDFSVEVSVDFSVDFSVEVSVDFSVEVSVDFSVEVSADFSVEDSVDFSAEGSSVVFVAVSFSPGTAVSIWEAGVGCGSVPSAWAVNPSARDRAEPATRLTRILFCFSFIGTSP